MNPAIEAIGLILTSGWRMLIGVTFPATDIPIAVIMIGAFVVCFGIRIFAMSIGKTVQMGSFNSNSSGIEKSSRRGK